MGPAHDEERNGAVRAAANAASFFQFDPRLTLTRDEYRDPHATPSCPRRTRDLEMYALARDAAQEIARLARHAAQVYEARAHQFDTLHTTADDANREELPR